MKIHSHCSYLSFILAVLLGATITPLIRGDSIATRVQDALKKVSHLELPSTAAFLMKSAAASEKEITAIQIIETVDKLNPVSMPSVVGAICRTVPTVADRTLREAVKLQPKQMPQIQRAAAPYLAPSLDNSGSTTRGASPIRNPSTNGKSFTTLKLDESPPCPDADNTNGNGKKKGHYKSPGE